MRLRYGAEMMGPDGPTGEIREVVELAVLDYGDNELWRGVPGQEPAYRIPTQKVATRVGAVITDCDELVTDNTQDSIGGARAAAVR